MHTFCYQANKYKSHKSLSIRVKLAQIEADCSLHRSRFWGRHATLLPTDSWWREVLRDDSNNGCERRLGISNLFGLAVYLFVLNKWHKCHPNTIDQVRYIKIQPKTIDLSTRLWGINTEFVGFIPQSLMLRPIVLS